MRLETTHAELQAQNKQLSASNRELSSANQEYQRQIEQLIQAKTEATTALQSRTEFLANVSHEIRTPMSAILGYTDILSSRLSDADNLNCVETIRRNGRHLLTIINDLLDLAKLEADHLKIQNESFSPAALVAEVCSMMGVQASEKNLALNVRFDGLLPATIRSDPRRLKQILINLIGNAVKFTEQGSIDLQVKLLEARQCLQFRVIDTGVGICETQQSRLFQPFQQGDNSVTRAYQGTGLGLAISRRLAHLMEGEIDVHSKRYQGSTFTLTIATGPLENIRRVTPSLELTPLQTHENSPLRRLHGRVLVVDDRQDIRTLLCQYLEDAGAQVSAAADGEAAIAAVSKAGQAGESFMVIVMDMQMPVLDGYRATRQLRQQGFKRPIVALTADAVGDSSQRCIDAGCNDYLTKPVKADELVERIGVLMDAQLTKNNHLQHTDILVVDDSVDAAKALRRLLEFHGYRVETAYNGYSALDLARATQPAAIILDLNLPDIHGIQLANELRQDPELASSMLIALSGSEVSAETNLFDHQLLKPADIQQLIALLPAV